jgi:predicted house-cleaning noncanonical NTP pyrophosphatase (MazG superfamily)
VLEVVRALASTIGFGAERLEAARAANTKSNGAFDERYI